MRITPERKRQMAEHAKAEAARAEAYAEIERLAAAEGLTRVQWLAKQEALATAEGKGLTPAGGNRGTRRDG